MSRVHLFRLWPYSDKLTIIGQRKVITSIQVHLTIPFPLNKTLILFAFSPLPVYTQLSRLKQNALLWEFDQIKFFQTCPWC